MSYIDQKVISKTKEMDLLTYLQNYEPHELVRLSNNIYSTKTHDSLKISNGKWYWYSRNIGGKSALDYLIHVKGMSFTDAVTHITGKPTMKSIPTTPLPSSNSTKSFVLPDASRTTDKATEYLLSRGINREVIEYCIESGIVYESFPYHNTVFVGRDIEGTPKYAALRGKGFVGEARGSSKKYSFNIKAELISDTVHLFESPIDLLSYASLLKYHNREWRTDNLLSLSGVYKVMGCSGKTTIPISLEYFLENNPNTKKIVIRLDNDETGRLATASLIEVLSDRYHVEDKPPPSGKDYNDYLCEVLNLPQPKKRVYER